MCVKENVHREANLEGQDQQ